jgi:hypothetical protein
MRLDQPRGDRWSDTRSVRMNIDNAELAGRPSARLRRALFESLVRK